VARLTAGPAATPSRATRQRLRPSCRPVRVRPWAQVAKRARPEPTPSVRPGTQIRSATPHRHSRAPTRARLSRSTPGMRGMTRRTWCRPGSGDRTRRTESQGLPSPSVISRFSIPRRLLPRRVRSKLQCCQDHYCGTMIGVDRVHQCRASTGRPPMPCAVFGV
jgi:hypothetical protein